MAHHGITFSSKSQTIHEKLSNLASHGYITKNWQIVRREPMTGVIKDDLVTVCAFVEHFEDTPPSQEHCDSYCKLPAIIK